LDILINFLIIFGTLFVLLGIGVPIAYVMGALAIVFGYLYWSGQASLLGFVLSSYSGVVSFTLTAIPLFVFMAGVLRYADLAEEMFEAIYRWLGGLRGGLAAGCIAIGAIFGAMVGISTVATITMGVTARPVMLQKGYSDKLTLGSIMVGGNLGIIIPPSVLMILYGMVAQVSVGQMFMAGIIPGVLAAALFMLYVLVACYRNPQLGPALSAEERYSWKEKFIALKGVVLPVLVIVLVIGSILLGIATPTEAACMGVLGSLLCAVIRKKLNLDVCKKVMKMTVDIMCPIFLLLMTAATYSKIVAVSGISASLARLISQMGTSPALVLLGIQLVFFFLGMVIDPSAILFITAPVFLPVAEALGFNLIWYGILFVLNMCMAYMTPPFGLSFFILKGLDSKIDLKNLYLGATPFVVLFAVVILLLAVFPKLALWLPGVLG
jgi:tripartite ATP-independent transporter DctM subunit